MSETVKSQSNAKIAPWIMSPEVILREMHTLSDELSLIPAQAAAILQTTEDHLKSLREVGGGPPFEKLGDGRNAPVRYPLGALREWKKARTMINTAGGRISRFASQADFLTNGTTDDWHIFAEDRDGKLWDFWEAIKHFIVVRQVLWLSMDDFINRLRTQAEQNSANCEAEILRTEIGIPGIDNSDLGHGDTA